MTYLVVLAGRSKQTGSAIYVVGALNPRQAHEEATRAFRRENGLASSVAVQTATLFEADTEDACSSFVDRFDALLAERAPAP